MTCEHTAGTEEDVAHTLRPLKGENVLSHTIPTKDTGRMKRDLTTIMAIAEELRRQEKLCFQRHTQKQQGIPEEDLHLTEQEEAFVQSVLVHASIQEDSFTYTHDSQFHEELEKRLHNPELAIKAYTDYNNQRVCIDGGIKGNFNHEPGSGILRPRLHYTLPTSAEYEGIFEHLRSLNLDVSWFESDTGYRMLLPTEDVLRHWLLDKASDHLGSITWHEECGAAKLDLRRILEKQLYASFAREYGKSPEHAFERLYAAVRTANIALNREEDYEEHQLIHLIVDHIIEHTPQETVNAHARNFSQAVAKELDMECSHITIKDMDRPEGAHLEEAVYIDFMTGLVPNVGFDYRKVGLPQGFKLQPKSNSWPNTLKQLKLSLAIALGGEGMHKQNPFTPARPFQIVMILSPEHPFLDRKIEQKQQDIKALIATEYPQYADILKISAIAPCMNNPDIAPRFETLLRATVRKQKKETSL